MMMTVSRLSSFCLVYVSLSAQWMFVCSLDDEGLTVPELIRFWGYPVESHDVTTEDGYILTIHRIPHGRNNFNTTRDVKRPVIFLQHGLLCSSSNWVVNLPHQSLGFILADSGFDVFMGNVRGNTYGRRHEYRTTRDAKFWDYSFDEHAKYDLPAMVDHVLKITHEKQVYYIGHSMGTMMAFAKLSEDITFQKKIKVFFALAPVARLRHMYGPIELLSQLETYFKFLFNLLRIRSFLSSADALVWLSEKLCPWQPSICNRITFVTSSLGLENFNKTRRPIYLDHTPAGTSVRNIYHFMQLVKEEEFQKYDYGFWGNVRKYGSTDSPSYNLRNIRNKIVIYYGSKDWLTHPKDVRWLSGRLPGLTKIVKIQGYNHLDFVWGLDAREEIYEDITNIINDIENREGNAKG